MSYVVIANFGNESIALIQWLYEHQYKKVIVLSVDTGWAAPSWQMRVDKACHWITSLHYESVRLNASSTMQDCVEERGEFPNKKFQWCAGFLKGLVLNDYLDDIDPGCEATLVFAKRRSSSRTNRYLKDHEESERFNHRRVWHPVLAVSDAKRNALLKLAGFNLLPHLSLECSPCIHSKGADIQRLSPEEIQRLDRLEKETNHTMFHTSIVDYSKQMNDTDSMQHACLEAFDMGCGSAFGCGE